MLLSNLISYVTFLILIYRSYKLIMIIKIENIFLSQLIQNESLFQNFWHEHTLWIKY